MKKRKSKRKSKRQIDVIAEVKHLKAKLYKTDRDHRMIENFERLIREVESNRKSKYAPGGGGHIKSLIITQY